MNREGLRVNHTIRVREVRVIDPEGKQLGILPVAEARAIADEQGLDLVEVAPTERPPVCRIMDYGKFKYQQSKRSHTAKKKQKTQQLKEVKLTPKTGEHDLNYKLNNARRFLAEGNKVKVTVTFRGREMMHLDRGRRALDQVRESLEDVAVQEQNPTQEGRRMAAIFIPKPPSKESAAKRETQSSPEADAEPVQS